MGTHRVITFTLKQGESGRWEEKWHIPFTVPFSGHQNQCLGCQPSSEAVECCLCCSGAAPCMPEATACCPLFYQHIWSKGQKCTLAFSRKKCSSQRLCSCRKRCLQHYLVPTVSRAKAQACPCMCGDSPEGYSASSLRHGNSWCIEALAGRYLRKHVMYRKTL